MITPVLVLICIVLIVSIIVLYIINQDKTCTHKGVKDPNAEYTTDEEGKCKFVRCKDTTYIQDSTGICVLDQSGQGCTPEGTPDANAIYETNVSNVCEFSSCIIGYEVGENDICIMAELEDEDGGGGSGGGSNGGTGGGGGTGADDQICPLTVTIENVNGTKYWRKDGASEGHLYDKIKDGNAATPAGSGGDMLATNYSYGTQYNVYQHPTYTSLLYVCGTSGDGGSNGGTGGDGGSSGGTGGGGTGGGSSGGTGGGSGGGTGGDGGSSGGTGGDGGSSGGTGGGSGGGTGGDGGSSGGTGGDPEPEVCLYTAKSIIQGTRGYRWNVFLKADPSTGVFGGPFTALFSNPYTTSLIYPTENNLGKQFDVKQMGSGFQICNDGDESTESDTVNCQNYLPDEAIISTAPSDATRYYVAQDHATHGMTWGSYIYIPGHEDHLEISGTVKHSHPPPTQSAIDCEYSIWVDYTGVGNISKKIGRRS